MKMGIREGSVWAASALAAWVSIGGPTRAQAPAPSLQPKSYVRAIKDGAKLFNLPDKNGEVVSKIARTGLLAVYGERAGYLEVEPPGGLEVWVYGEYTKPTDQAGLIEITTNGVRMRPLPDATEKSYPLAQGLDKGDRVRMIARADPKKPIKEDWIKIYSPPGTRAWVTQGDTQALAAGEDAHALWMNAVKDFQARLKAADAALEADAPVAAGTAEAGQAGDKAVQKSDALEGAEKLMAAARASDKPDFKPARAAYQRVIDANSKSAAAETARARLGEIDAREEIHKLNQDAKMAEEKRAQKLEEANVKLREASLSQDNLWGRFQARGWLEKDGDGYVIRWGGRTTSELVCREGRYDLAAFVGSEIGIIGVTTRSAIAASGASEAHPMQIDAKRIEVISTRGI